MCEMLHADVVRWRLWSHSRSRGFRRWQARLRGVLGNSGSGDLEMRRLLEALLLIETHERSALERTVEWCASWLNPSRSITRGPYQLVRAPWSFARATRMALERLQHLSPSSSTCLSDIERLAKAWNGAAHRQPGSAVGYARAINLALAVLADQKRTIVTHTC